MIHDESIAPPIAYAGGKRRLARWITDHFPRQGVRRYVEACIGGGGVFCSLAARYPQEVINDLDGGVSAFWTALRDHQEALVRAVTLTPFSRPEWEHARDVVRATGYPDDVVEAARLFLIISQQSYGRVNRPSSGWRLQRPDRTKPNVLGEWALLPDKIAVMGFRLQNVAVERRQITDLVSLHDSPQTLFYIDPPYHPETCAVSQCYRLWMRREEHETMAAVLNAARGMIVLSGYQTADYAEWFAGWRREDCAFMSSLTGSEGAGDRRVESLWINRACDAALTSGQLQLFSEVP